MRAFSGLHIFKERTLLLLTVSFIVSLLAAFIWEQPALMGIPFLLLFVAVCFIDLRIAFWTFLFTLPLSQEVHLGSSLAIDLPNEPLMWSLLAAGGLYVLMNAARINARYLTHPATILLLLGYSWMWVSTLFSDASLISVKFSLAKTWYIAAMYFCPFLMLRKKVDYQRIFWLILIPLFFAIIVVIYQHSEYDFTLRTINKAVRPFFRNKVIFGGFLACMLPFVGLLFYQSKGRFYRRLFLILITTLLLAGIWISFTRAAMACVLLLPVLYIVLRLRLMRYALIVAFFAIGILTYNLYQQNNYLSYAPNYEKTVSHADFESLMDATVKGRDVSSMERIYRWVAAAQMVKDQHWLGFGPGTFYTFYRRYTLSMFRTYVSHNPERSGIHNYYLMLLVEQGIFGLLFYLAFMVYVLLRGEHLWHSLQPLWQRQLLMACLLCLLSIHTLQVMNDLLETAKIGSLYFICTAIIVMLDVRNQGSVNS